MELLNIERAREFVIVINDPSAMERAIKAARSSAPRLFIIARTNYLGDINLLSKAGADLVIPAEREAAVAVTSSIMDRHSIDLELIDKECACIRQQVEENHH